MNKKVVGIVVFCLIILLFLLGWSFYNDMQEEKKSESQYFEINNSIVRGGTILDEYNSHLDEIKNGTYSIIINNRMSQPILYDDYSTLADIIYKFINYDRELVTKGGITTVNYYIQSYGDLIKTVTQSELFDKRKFQLYYIDEIEVTPKQRELKEGEIYGKDVIGNYRGHKEAIENGSCYFNVKDGSMISSINTEENLLKTVKEDDIFIKEFELDNRGNLAGYTFTKQ